MDPFNASLASTSSSNAIIASERNIFIEFENENSLKIPDELKNLLIFNGFDNAVTLSKMDGSDILKMEQIARDHIPDLVPAKDFHKYLGPFKSSPSRFFIMPGQKRLLNELIVFADQRRSKNKRFRTPSTESHPGYDEKRPIPENYYELHNDIVENPSSPNEQTVLTYNYLSPSEAINMRKLLEHWIMNFCTSNLTPEQMGRVSHTIPRIKLHSPDGLQCIVTCCICLKEQKLYRSGQGTSWIMSNFHKHFKTHFVPGKKYSRNFISSYNHQQHHPPVEENSGGSSMAEDDLVIDEKPIIRPFTDSFP